jgi:hypothetical protein
MPDLLPHEMTLAVYIEAALVDDVAYQNALLHQKDSDPANYEVERERAERTPIAKHECAVTIAVLDGLHVPAEVLVDYPELRDYTEAA